MSNNGGYQVDWVAAIMFLFIAALGVLLMIGMAVS